MGYDMWRARDWDGGEEICKVDLNLPKKHPSVKVVKGCLSPCWTRFGVSGGDRGVIFFSRRMFANVTAIVGRHVR
jgi:hypothetical protein